MSETLLKAYCNQWNLADPKLLASTFTSEVYLVQKDRKTVVLKILKGPGKTFEGQSAKVLKCFDGLGTVRLLQSDDGAHLLEYLSGTNLKSLVEKHQDQKASEIICQVVQKIHSYSGVKPEGLHDMQRRFRSLFEKAKLEPSDSIYRRGAQAAEELIATEQEPRILHGDIHHENIIESRDRGWLAIDPQSFFGERTYEIANAFYNPSGFLKLNEQMETIQRQCDIFVKNLNLERGRTLKYAFAHGCLSAAWSLEDAQSPEFALKIANQIQTLLKT